MVVVVTFEAEGWPNRILACGRRLLLMNLDALPLFDYVPMLQICSSIFVSYWVCFSDSGYYDFRGRRLAELLWLAVNVFAQGNSSPCRLPIMF
jgi:hypothetical protein